jgi:16S rRNA (uracil1498-N3)-methyltransferase
MSALPLFFQPHIGQVRESISLDEATARHIVQVLRMQAGDAIALTDGAGNSATAHITETSKKSCKLLIDSLEVHPLRAAFMHLGIAFTRHSGRNEWLLEKATELGVRSIIPLQTSRGLKEKFRYDRWHNILVSAMLQSQQYHLPQLSEPMSLQQLAGRFSTAPQKFMAHCMDNLERRPLASLLKPGLETVFLIGPEGDFTPEEVKLCSGAGFEGVSIGAQRLRTETAVLTVCAFFNVMQHETN